MLKRKLKKACFTHVQISQKYILFAQKFLLYVLTVRSVSVNYDQFETT